MLGTSKYDLEEVKKLVLAGRFWISAPSRSIDEVVRVYVETSWSKSEADARNFICEGLLALRPGNFAGRAIQWSGEVADQYGLIFDGRPWFVKFLIGEDGDVEEISFHPPARPLKTQDGSIISAEGK